MENTKKIILDGNYMKTRQKAHKYLARKLELPSYYGNNLDALWDCLSTYSQGIDIDLINEKRAIELLGDYGRDIIQVFKDAELENNNISFKIRPLF